jgi:hypothetical protein
MKVYDILCNILKNALGIHSYSVLNHTLSLLLILFIYSLFNDTFSISEYIESNERMIVNWKGCGRKRSWPNSRYYPGIWLEGLRKISVRIAGLQADI